MIGLNPEVHQILLVTSIDSNANNEFVIAGIMSGSTTMSMGSTSITSTVYRTLDCKIRF